MDKKEQVLELLKTQKKRKHASRFRYFITYCIGKIMVDYDVFITRGEFYNIFLSDLFSSESYADYIGKKPHANGDKMLDNDVKNKLMGLLIDSEEEFIIATSGVAFTPTKATEEIVRVVQDDYMNRLHNELGKQLKNKI